MTTRQTPERILDVAERHFARRGYYGASLRSITTEAGVQLALVHYHFKSKEKLYRAVIARRVEALTAERIARLEAGGGRRRKPRLEHVVRALVAPTVELCSNDSGGRFYGQMLGQLINNPEERAQALLIELFDPVARRFIAAARAAAPRLDAAAAHWGYYFAIGAMVQALAKTGRIERLSGGRCDSRDALIIIDNLTRFITAGFNALAASQSKGKAAKNRLAKRQPRKKARLKVAALAGGRSAIRDRAGGRTR
jgi:AcrR family transcriptional regulator